MLTLQVGNFSYMCVGDWVVESTSFKIVDRNSFQAWNELNS